MSRRSAVFAVALLALAAFAPQVAVAEDEKKGRVESSVSVSNEPPTNVQIEINRDEDAGSPGTQVTAEDVELTVTVRADDGNGARDLRRAIITVHAPDGSVLVASLEADAQGDGHGRARTFKAKFPLSRDAAPGAYAVQAVVADRFDVTAQGDATLTVLGRLALAVETAAISFGENLGPGSSTHGAPSAVVIRNVGSLPLDIRVRSDGLRSSADDARIKPDRIFYSTSADMANERALSKEGLLDDAFDLAIGATGTFYLDLHMPTGDEAYVPADTYSGKITIGGVAG